MRYIGMRTLTAFLAGETPGPGAAVFKLYWSECHRNVSALAVELLGPAAMTPAGKRPNRSIPTDDPGAPNDSASWVATFLNARAGTIYAGASEVQRNIIAELLLGLPKEAPKRISQLARGPSGPVTRDRRRRRSKPRLQASTSTVGCPAVLRRQPHRAHPVVPAAPPHLSVR